jgi:hypothetical protein
MRSSVAMDDLQIPVAITDQAGRSLAKRSHDPARIRGGNAQRLC